MPDVPGMGLNIDIDVNSHDGEEMSSERRYEPGTAFWPRSQAETYERTDGRQAATRHGRRIVVLTTVGARTGGLRKTALMRVEHGGQYLAVASNAGSPRHPSWYWNLRAHPVVGLQDLAERHEYDARDISGDERFEWWERAVRVWPEYDDYQRSAARAIPAVLLTRRREG
jgi:F420H(2)-dependent quinone reductase